MAIDLPFCLVTPRDCDLFQALDRCPLTVRQLLKLSSTFAYCFTAERRVQERLQRLCAVGRVRRWRYATAGQGALSYYTLTPLGYRLLHGPDSVPSGRGRFGPVGVARQAHTQALAEVIVQVIVAAHKTGVSVEEFHRENALRLDAGDESLYPDAAFVLRPSADRRLSYFVEIDNRTESVRSTTTPDSWERKVKFYEQYQDSRLERFRVLAITTGGPARLEHMLACSAEAARNPRRSLVYGTTLSNFLTADEPLAGSCFRNHHMNLVPLVPPHREIPLTAEEPAVSFPACLRTLAEV